MSLENDSASFGPYELIRRVARGGMAEIFLAVERGFQGVERQVAIKRILPHMVEAEDFVTMFMDEARVATRLAHPNIAHIYSFGEVEGVYYLAMEYVDGMTCSRMVRAARPETIPIEITLRILADVCSALHYAHDLRDNQGALIGLVHRDVNPQNVMVSRNGVAKLLDFGVARASTQSHATRVGQVKGKIGYIAPEVFRGNPLDHRADIFSAGTLLFELLSGKKLFRREIEAATIHAILHDKPPSLSESLDVPPEVDEIVARALAKDPEDRYPNAFEMQQDLEELISDRGYAAAPFVVGRFVRELFETQKEAELLRSSEPSGASASLLFSVGSSQLDSSAGSASLDPPSASGLSAPATAQSAEEFTVVDDGAPSSLSELQEPEEQVLPEAGVRSADPSNPDSSSLPKVPPPPVIPPPPEIPPPSEFSLPSQDDGERPQATPTDAGVTSEASASGAPPPQSFGVLPGDGWQDDDAETRVMLHPAGEAQESQPEWPESADEPDAAWGDEEPLELTPRSSRPLILGLFGVGLLLIIIAGGILFVWDTDEEEQAGGGGGGVGGVVGSTKVAAVNGSEEGGATSEGNDAGRALVDAGVAESVDTGAAPPSKAAPDAGATPDAVRRPSKSSAAGEATKTPAPREPRLAPGELYLHTNPWSKVRVAGRNLGTTPIVGASLPAGVHTLYLSDASGERHTRRVRIRPGRATKLSLDFRQ